MDKIKRGQAELTIIDLTDDRKLVGFLSTSKARQVIYNPNTDTYTPDFSTENMTIKPELYISGSGDNVIATAKSVKWYYRENTLGNRQPITASNDTYTINSDRSLTIKKNILAGNLTYEFIADIEYVEPNSELITIIPTNVELVLVNSGEDGAVGFQGEPGADGKPTYTHIAWANSEDGTVDFSTTVSKSKAFVGMYVDNIEKNSTNPVDYNWSQIRGNDGISVTGIAEYYLTTTKKEGVTLTDAGWSGSVQIPTKEKPYLWNYEVVNYSMGDSDKSEPALIGMYAEDGVGIETVTNKYLTTSLGTGVTVGNTGWVETPVPTTQSLRYLWSYSVIRYTNGNSENTPVALIGVHGEKGDKGIQGVKGADGTSSYTHIAYANSSNGVDGFSKSDPTDKLYVGMYVDNTELDSDNPSDYKWSRIKGLDGKDGIPGTKGADGRTPYLHIAYADDDKGTNFDVSDPTNRKYLGTYTDYTQADSVNYTDYTWSLVKGDKGDVGPRGIQGATGPQGNQGIQGPKGIDGKPSYTHIAYADTISGANLSFTDASKPYIGIYTDSKETSASAPTSYTWSKWLGEDGNDGIPGAKGADGKDSYTHFAYATNETGTLGFSTTDSLNKSYLGIYTDSTKNDSDNPSDYTWTLIKGATGATGPRGVQGLQGPQGDKGIPGAKGADGKTTYTHIAYASGTSGENFNHSTFSTATHVGMYTSLLETSSGNWQDYQWTLIRGRDGTQGIQGPKGTDGSTPYFHIAYANNETGTDGFSVNDSLNKKYMGTYTDFTENDSTNPGDYTWSLIKGDDGISITEVVENYLITTLKTGVTRATSGWSTTPQTATKAKPYLWNYKLVKYSSGSNSPTDPVMIGMYTEDGVGIESITNMYLTTTQSSGVTLSTPGWSSTPDTATSTDGAPLYVWNYETIKYTNGTSKTSPVALIGVHGAKGIPGDKGSDGRTSYTHIGYANSSDGSKDFSTVISEGRSYVGMYTDFTEKSSSNPTDYKWTLIRGADGAQGIPGKAGIDGKTPYFHTAWADSADGSSGFSTTVSENKLYLGTATTYTQDDPTDYKKYRWTLVKGEKGDMGPQGPRGITGATGPQGTQGIKGADGKDGLPSYTHIAYADNASGGGFSATDSSKAYIGIYADSSPTSSSTASKYTWSKWHGEDGSDGVQGPKGVDGLPSYTHFAYATNATGTEGFSTTVSLNKAYLGIYTDNTKTDSTDPKNYTWSLIKGADGARGPQGIQGLQGPQGNQGIKGETGADGKTSYTHIAYASGASGENFNHSSFSTATHVGMYTSFLETSSGNWQDYKWTLIRGRDGSQGIQGKAGADGKTPYLHIAYANNATGTSGFSINDSANKLFIGTYTDFLATDSTVPSKYKWTLVKGDTGDQGPRGLQGLQGPQGTQGIAGKTGADGRTSYTHIAWATNSTGTSGFSNTVSSGKTYIGVYTDFNESNSTNPSDYKWSLIKGADGSQGLPGKAGADGRTPYFHTAWANNITGTSGFSTTVSTGKTHIGTYSDFTASDSTNAGDYKWVLIKGETGATGSQGIPGKAGADGRTPYFHTAYADNATGTLRFSTTDSNREYMGTYTDFTSGSSTSPSAYKWTRVKGDPTPTLTIMEPQGTTIRNDKNNVELDAVLLSGGDEVTPTSYKWYYYKGATGTTIGTSKKVTITPALVTGSLVVYLEVMYSGKKYTSTTTIDDISDPFSVQILGVGTFKNGVGANTYTAKVYQLGTEVDTGGSIYNYKWEMFTTTGAKVTTFNKTGKTVVINASEISSTNNITCTVSTK